jgi:superoxide dismutase, Fe-Mn family
MMGGRTASNLIDRRGFMLTLTAGSVLAASGMLGLHGCAQSSAAFPFTLPPLPYEKNALEPYISRTTIECHYGKHHRGYVDKTNDLAQSSGLSGLTLEEVIKQTYGSADSIAVFNNAAQAWNHQFYWQSMRPGGTKPGDLLETIIKLSFGSYDALRAELRNAAAAQFGSGWVWLVLEGEKLKVTKTGNADNPLVHRQIPLLTIDVWEHAYYLDYQNRRAEYVDAVIDHLLNWEFAVSNLNRA